MNTNVVPQPSLRPLRAMVLLCVWCLSLQSNAFTFAQDSPDQPAAQEEAKPAAVDPEIRKLIEDLESRDLKRKRDAAYALAALREKSLPALPALIKTVRSERDIQVWNQAATAIARIGKPAEEAIPALLKQLESREDQRKYRAAFALGKIGPSAVDGLIKSLQSRSSSTRAAAALALGWMEEKPLPAISELAWAISDSDADVRTNSADALVKIGDAAKADVLAALKESDDTEFPEVAIELLGRLGNPSPEAMERIQSALKSNHDESRAAAVSALFMVNGAQQNGAKQNGDKQNIDLLRQALTDESEIVRDVALVELRRGKLQNASVLPVLQKLLANEKSDTAKTAARALGAIGPAAKSAVPDLIDQLIYDSQAESEFARAIVRIGPSSVRALLGADGKGESGDQQIAVCLAKIGPRAMPELIAALKDHSDNIRFRAINSLGQMAELSSDGFDALAQQLPDSNPEIRAAAAQAIGTARKQLVGSKTAFDKLAALSTSDAVPAVRKNALLAMSAAANNDQRIKLLENSIRAALKDSAVVVQRTAFDAIASNPKLAGRFSEEVIAALGSEDTALQSTAARAVGSLGEKGLKDSDRRNAVGKALDRLLETDSTDAKTAAAEAIRQTKIVTESTVEKLARLLSDSDGNVVQKGIDALAALKQDASSAVPALLKLDAHPDVLVRQSIASALPKLESDANRIVPLLVNFLKDKEWTVRREAAQSLGDIGEAAVEAVPDLFALLSSEDDKDAARSALREIDTADIRAVPILIEGLKSDDRRKKYYSVFLLQKVGPEGAAALPHLRKAKAESDSNRFTGMISRAIDAIDVESPDDKDATKKDVTSKDDK